MLNEDIIIASLPKLEPLIRCISNSTDISELDHILQGESSPYSDEELATALSWAFVCSNTSFIPVLEENNANKFTALVIALRSLEPSEQLELVKKLCADNIVSVSELSAYCAQLVVEGPEYYPIIEVLFEAGATQPATILALFKSDPNMTREKMEELPFDLQLDNVDEKGNTCLMKAIMSGKVNVAKRLIHEGADVKKENDAGQTPLFYAHSARFTEIEMLIRQTAPDIIATHLKVTSCETLRQYTQRRKAEIMAKGPARSIPPDEEAPSAAQRIAANLFVNGDTTLGSRLTESLEQLYSESPLVVPLLELIAQETSPTYEESKGKYKHFKIIGAPGDSLDSIMPQERNSTRGVYTLKHSVFVATAFNVSSDETFLVPQTLGRMLHESTHYVMNKIYQNKALPYEPENLELEEWLAKAMRKDYRSVYYLQEAPGSLEEIAQDTVLTTFNYPKHQQAIEYVVKVPQVMAILGPEKGEAWLQKNTPGLYKFYTKSIQPKLIEHNKTRSQEEPSSRWQEYMRLRQNNTEPEL